MYGHIAAVVARSAYCFLQPGCQEPLCIECQRCGAFRTRKQIRKDSSQSQHPYFEVT